MEKERTVHHVKPRQLGDRALFASAFGIGVVATLSVKAIGAGPIFVALVPVLVIMTYAITTWYLPRVTLEPDMIGDNCYYLGFMLTLVSLSWTLYGVSKDPENLNLVREIVSGFGVALSSTITGIFLRAFFLQLRPDVVSSERRARHDILNAARELRKELYESLKELKDFSRGVQQSLAEHQGNLDAAIKAAMESHKEWMQRYAADTAKEIASVHRASIEGVVATMSASAQQATASFQSSLESSATGLNTTVETLTQRLDQAGSHIETRAQRVADSVQSIDAAAIKAAGEVEVASSALAIRLNGAADRFGEAVQGVNERIASFGTGIDESVTRAKAALNDASTQFAGSLSGAASSFSDTGKTAAAELREIAKYLKVSGQSVQGAAAILTDAGAQVSRMLAALEEAERKATALRSMPSESEVHAVRTILEEAVTELRRLTEEVAKLAKFTARAGAAGEAPSVYTSPTDAPRAPKPVVSVPQEAPPTLRPEKPRDHPQGIKGWFNRRFG